MLVLPCPTCGQRIDADESFAGKRVLCPHCNAEVLISKADGAFQEGLPPVLLPERAPEVTKEATPFFLRALPIFLITGIVFFAIVLIIPLVSKVRQTAARTQSTNNLKQIGLAMQSFYDTNRRLPFNGIAAGQKVTPPDSKITYFGNATTDCTSSGSWIFQIIPYCDSTDLFRMTGIAESDVVPEKWKNAGSQTFLCPGRGRQAFITDAGPWSDYHINIVLNSREEDGKLVIGFDVPDVKRKLEDITDGVSNTIFAGHGYMNRDAYDATTSQGNFSSVIWTGGTEGTGRAFGVPAPKNLALGVGPAAKLMRDDWQSNSGITSATTPQPWGGPFAEGILIVFCDGRVRLVPYATNQNESRRPNFGAMLTPTNGDENIQPD